MSDVQNFIEVPTQAQSFVSRVRLSLRTSLRFIVDQKWASLAFLMVYMGLLFWDFQSVRLLPTPPNPDWTQNWPEFLAPFREQLARQSMGTWRAMLAGLVTLLYWGNGLLYIADRSEAFNELSVVGLVRYIMRSIGVTLLLLIPVALGFALLVIPGLLVSGILIAAATIAMFQTLGIFRAIAEGYRLVTKGLPGHARILGFSRSLVHIVGGYVVVIVCSLGFAFGTTFVAALLNRSFPSLSLPVNFVQTSVSNLLSSFLNLSFSIFVLRMYSEYLFYAGPLQAKEPTTVRVDFQ